MALSSGCSSLDMGRRCSLLGTGYAAGSAAGLAVVPVAAEVHLNRQSAVGPCLVLAAVVCGRATRSGRQEGEPHWAPAPVPVPASTLSAQVLSSINDASARDVGWPPFRLSVTHTASTPRFYFERDLWGRGGQRTEGFPEPLICTNTASNKMVHTKYFR